MSKKSAKGVGRDRCATGSECFERARRRRATRFFFLFLFSGLSTTPAFCDQKDEWLANCLWEVERTMVLYRAIHEGGYAGKAEMDIYQQLTEQMIRAPVSSEKYQSLKRIENQRLKESNDREEDIQNKLMDRCMNVHGYRYAVESKTIFCIKTRAPGEFTRIGNENGDCWVPVLH